MPEYDEVEKEFNKLKDEDFAGVKEEETLTPRELGYSGDEDFTPESVKMAKDNIVIVDAEDNVLSITPRPAEDADTHDPDDDAVERCVDDPDS